LELIDHLQDIFFLPESNCLWSFPGDFPGNIDFFMSGSMSKAFNNPTEVVKTFLLCDFNSFPKIALVFR
jgi:hypothetical protein